MSQSLLGFSLVLLLVYLTVTPGAVHVSESKYQRAMAEVRHPERYQIFERVQEIKRDPERMKEIEIQVDFKLGVRELE